MTRVLGQGAALHKLGRLPLRLDGNLTACNSVPACRDCAGNHDCERADCRFNLTRWDKTGNKLSLTTYGPKVSKACVCSVRMRLALTGSLHGGA